jgi:exodeoxyribonuclease III
LKHKSYCEDFKYVLPIEVTVNNEKIMNLIAVWAQKNDEKDTKRRYIGNVWCALNHYKELLETPTIIAGDFNWNVIWDNNSNYSAYIKQHSAPSLSRFDIQISLN